MDLLEKSETAGRHPWELARLDVVKYLLDKEIKNFKEKKILDLGCGDLFFIREFAKDKPECDFYAVDTAFTEGFIEEESRKTPVVLSASLEDLTGREKVIFDVIFLMDVVEHIEHDVAFLNDLIESSCVSGDTLFVITVPAFQQLFTDHDVFLGHYRRYTNSSLEKVVNQAGMKSLKKGYFFTSLLLPRYLEKIVQSREAKKEIKGTGLSSWDKNRFITKSLKTVLLLDFRVTYFLSRAGFILPGLSNYLLCKKRV